MNPLKVWILPSEEFDYLDTRKELLEKFGPFVGKNYDLPAEVEHAMHGPDLDRNKDGEYSEASQSTGA